jgi:hypothetical protein
MPINLLNRIASPLIDSYHVPPPQPAGVWLEHYTLQRVRTTCGSRAAWGFLETLVQLEEKEILVSSFSYRWIRYKMSAAWKSVPKHQRHPVPDFWKLSYEVTMPLCGLFHDNFSTETIQRWKVRWMMNWKGSGRKRSRTNRDSIPEFAWENSVIIHESFLCVISWRV